MIKIMWHEQMEQYSLPENHIYPSKLEWDQAYNKVSLSDEEVRILVWLYDLPVGTTAEWLFQALANQDYDLEAYNKPDFTDELKNKVGGIVNAWYDFLNLDRNRP